jgi:serine protease Do
MNRFWESRHSLCALVMLCLAMSGMTSLLRAQDDLQTREEEAMKAAVRRAAASVVSIETVGGLERVGTVLFGTGPTTGLIVSEDGFIISSAFNFAQKPTSILVGLPDGTRTPARLIATDRNRMLVLLKVQVDEKLAVPEVMPEKDIQVGQWSIAIGRTFDSAQPNISVGIVSATQRIWGKAIQTDAKISPSNYGGPLIDIRGRVMGVLVPLAPDKTGEIAGVAWYDSGIGFAVPLEHVNKILPQLKQGKDMHPGIMGVNLKKGDIYADAPVIVAARPNSPAYKAGFKSGDRIAEVDGQIIERQAQLTHQIARRYAGEKIHVVVMRGKEKIERDLELIDKLAPYHRPFVGILPFREPTVENADAPPGITVRYVFAGSPAAKAGLQEGDRVLSLDGDEIKSRDSFAEDLAALEVGQKIKLEYRRGDETKTAEFELAGEADSVPEKLPPARASREPHVGDRAPVGTLKLKLPEEKNECLAYVPGNYDPQLQYGILLWLHAPGAFEDDKLIERWKAHCDEHDLILVAPRSVDKARWAAGDLGYLRKALDHIKGLYTIDPLRIAAVGHQNGGAMASLLAFHDRDLIRGVASIDSPLGGAPPDNDPVYRLTFFITTAKKANFAAQIQAGILKLREMQYPVTLKDQGALGHDLTDDERAMLLRWIDSLDRI